MHVYFCLYNYGLPPIFCSFIRVTSIIVEDSEECSRNSMIYYKVFYDSNSWISRYDFFRMIWTKTIHCSVIQSYTLENKSKSKWTTYELILSRLMRNQSKLFFTSQPTISYSYLIDRSLCSFVTTRARWKKQCKTFNLTKYFLLTVEIWQHFSEKI